MMLQRLPLVRQALMTRAGSTGVGIPVPKCLASVLLQLLLLAVAGALATAGGNDERCCFFLKYGGATYESAPAAGAGAADPATAAAPPDANRNVSLPNLATALRAAAAGAGSLRSAAVQRRRVPGPARHAANVPAYTAAASAGSGSSGGALAMSSADVLSGLDLGTPCFSAQLLAR